MSQDAAMQSVGREPRLTRAKAELDGLVELISIFTHDLSNPLQSITVLCELAVDDAALGSDDRQRNEHCLSAAGRMRDLIHGLAGVARYADGMQSIGSMMKRATALLERRFARHLIETEIDVAAIETMRPANACEHAIINIALGFVASAAVRGGKHQLRVTGRGDDDRGIVEFAARSGQGADEETLWPSAEHLQRVEALLANEPASIDVGESSVVLRCSPREV